MVASIIGAFFLGCAPAPEGRVVILGMDGLEYDALDRFHDELPNFTAFLAEGAHAQMAVTTPIMSPILWTTLASGYPADIHGVGGWTTASGRSFTGADVGVARIWDVLSADDRKSVVSGWLMTWPASAIEGVLLSDRFVWSVPMNRDRTRNVVVEHHEVTTFPDALAAQATPLVPDEKWLAASPLGYQIEQYGAPSHPLRRDELHTRVFEAFWPTSGADFGAIYLNGADQVSHLYWPYQEPRVQELMRQPGFDGKVPGTPEHPASRWVPDYYRYLDSVLGRIRAVVGPDTTLILVSDHGFRMDEKNPLRAGQHHDVAVFAAVGPHVRAHATGKIHVFDVAPTVYALLGLPAADDMPGHLATDFFDIGEQPRVPTRALRRGSIAVGSGAGGAGNDALREQLEALGYLDEEGLPNAAIGASRSARPQREASPATTPPR